MPRFYAVAVLQAAYPALPMALKSAYRGRFSLTGVSWRRAAQNIVSLVHVFICWQWKVFQSVGLIKRSKEQGHSTNPHHCTVAESSEQLLD